MASGTEERNFFQNLCNAFGSVLDQLVQHGDILALIHGPISNKFIEQLQLCWCIHMKEIKSKWEKVCEFGFVNPLSENSNLPLSDDAIKDKLYEIANRDASEKIFVSEWMKIINLIANYASDILVHSPVIKEFVENWNTCREVCDGLWCTALLAPLDTYDDMACRKSPAIKKHAANNDQKKKSGMALLFSKPPTTIKPAWSKEQSSLPQRLNMIAPKSQQRASNSALPIATSRLTRKPGNSTELQSSQSFHNGEYKPSTQYRTQSAHAMRDKPQTTPKPPLPPKTSVSSSYNAVMSQNRSSMRGQNIPNMDKPMQLITCSMDGRWNVCDPAVKILSSITAPMAVVSIVGKYRTGKSYLMNRLAGGTSGFGLGSTIQAETKGIWMWAKPHPKDTSRCMLLLDTEGLYDVEKGDKNNDIHLFTLAVLLSNCFVFNAVGNIDDTFITEMSLVAELTNRVRVRKSDVIGDADYFSTYFPNLFVVLRDFFLELEIDGKQITSDEYLEHALKLKIGTSIKAQNYNAPRNGISNFFPNRKCYVLPKPVEKDALLKDLHIHAETKLTRTFVTKCCEAVEGILNAAKPLTIDGNAIYGPGFAELSKEYVRALNENQVPCIESALVVMKDTECRRAYENALNKYKKEMKALVGSKLPMNVSRLEQLHEGTLKNAQSAFRDYGAFDLQGIYTAKLENDVEEVFQSYLKENDEISHVKCKNTIKRCFSIVEERYGKGDYSKAGGHAQFLNDQGNAIESYEMAPDLGPAKQRVLNAYMEDTASHEKLIIRLDEVMSEKQREEAMYQQRLRAQQEKWEQEKQERERSRCKDMRQQKEHEEFVQSLLESYEKKQQEQNKEHEAAMRRRRTEHDKALVQGLEEQAREHERIMSRLERDNREKNRQEDEIKKDREKLRQELKELQTAQREKERKYQREMRELKSEQNLMGSIEKDKLQRQQQAREEKHDREMAKLREQMRTLEQEKRQQQQQSQQRLREQQSYKQQLEQYQQNEQTLRQQLAQKQAEAQQLQNQLLVQQQQVAQMMQPRPVLFTPNFYSPFM